MVSVVEAQMKATFSLNNAGEREATLKVTMKISDWDLLLRQLADNGYWHEASGNWPASELYRNINDMITKVTHEYTQSVSGEV